MARRIRSHVRDLEGALNSLIAHARFSGRPIDLDYTQEILRDVLAVHDRLITIENIQKVVADYYQLRVTDLLSRRRNRSIARPRQMAMFLAKELTEHSCPRLATLLAAATTRQCCMPVVKLRAYVNPTGACARSARD